MATRKFIVQQWVTVDNIAAEEDGGLSFVWSLKLMHSMLDAGVVDEVRMLVCPVSRGKGTRIFADSQDLKLLEATVFENGLAILRYEIKRQAKSVSSQVDAPLSGW